MKVVFVHNQYRSSMPSGENKAVEEDIEALELRGVEVHRWIFSSDDFEEGPRLTRLAKIGAVALGPVYSSLGGWKFRRFLREVRPDVVHLHNVYPKISPWAILTAHGLNIPTVQTVHNFRRECAMGTFFRDGAICNLCTGRRLPVPAVLHSCYRGSRLQSVAMAVGLAYHRKTWAKVDRTIVLTDFQKNWLIEQGLESRNIMISPTSAVDAVPSGSSGNTVCYVGRLEDQKGVTDLIDSWEVSNLRNEGWTLEIAGEGPLEGYVRQSAEADQSVHYHGRLAPEDVSRLMASAAAVAVPSRCYEGFPKVVAEAFRYARPVVAVANANMSTVIGACGWLARTRADLPTTLDCLLDDREVKNRGNLARARYDTELRKEQAVDNLINCYRELSCESS